MAAGGGGVVTGDALMRLLRHAREHSYAIPAVNCVSSSSINAVLEAARDMRSPVIIQLSNGGSAFYAGKGLKNMNEQGSVMGAVSAALHVRTMARAYGVPVVLHTDHCARKLLPWLDGMVDADEDYFARHSEPLFSSHTLDLSEEPLKQNIETCAHYLQRLAAVGGVLEVELGTTGDLADGVDNTSADNASLYTQPEEIAWAYEMLSQISNSFLIAPSFGNVHGAYKPPQVILRPSVLRAAHDHILRSGLAPGAGPKPVLYAFHGASGVTEADLRESLANGVVKVNVDTDTQWAYWNGLREYEQARRPYLQAQTGNPEGDDKPNKKHYDPRVWMRKAELGLVDRVKHILNELGAAGMAGID